MIASQTAKDRQSVSMPYLQLRQKAITTRPSDLKIILERDEDVYGAVIDMSMPFGLVSMVMLYTGVTNLFMGNGKVDSHLEKKYAPTGQATQLFLANAGQTLDACKKVRAYDLPTGGHHFVYLLTRNGIFKTEINPFKLDKENQANKYLHYMYQKVMNEIRKGNIQVNPESK